MLATEMEKPGQQDRGEGPLTIGLVLAERLYSGQIRGGKLVSAVGVYPEGQQPMDPEDDQTLVEYHTDAMVEAICDAILQAADGQMNEVAGVGIALPGLVRNGIVEDAPNLAQLKGARIGELVTHALESRGLKAPVAICNDADAIAAGLAGQAGKLDSRIRVWTLGTGIGLGVYPFTADAWEGGHTVVTLDDRENFCGCGGRGHLEGIMGHRAMRLRFLDMEPEEVFAAATCRENPDSRCADFRNLWHRALAAATASNIHVMGAGRFYFTGYNVRFLDLKLLQNLLAEMIKMSPLQSYHLEIVPDDQSTRVLGAAIAAEQALVAGA